MRVVPGERPPPLTDVRGDYGVDAPYVPLMLAAGGVVLVAVAVANAIAASWAWTAVALVAGAGLLCSAGSYMYTTRRGKFRVWARILGGLGLAGGERVLDVGCGRGAVLLTAAKLLPSGRATGLDLWKASDQSGNALDVTRRNAEREGVADRVDLRTGDMLEMPFDHASFDIVVSSLAIHNIESASGRAAAIDQAVRVLRPGGRLAVADIRATAEYERRLRELGMSDVVRRPLGWRFWFGGPWMSTTLVCATKPAVPPAGRRLSG
jgi:SAM-dependent methyltransferase